jgi:hypothetical protein
MHVASITNADRRQIIPSPCVKLLQSVTAMKLSQTNRLKIHDIEGQVKNHARPIHQSARRETLASRQAEHLDFKEPPANDRNQGKPDEHINR